MFRNHKRKSRPISTPATHTFFASDVPDNCENGITAFAAKFDISLDENDVYGNLEFKSFLEDAVPIKICDTTESHPESETNLQSENGNIEQLVQMDIRVKQDEENGSDLCVPQTNCEFKDAGLYQKRAMSVIVEGAGNEAMKDDEEGVFLRGSSASLVGSSLPKRKGRAPPPPKRLSSLHPLEEDMCQDLAISESCSPLQSHDSETDTTGCDRSNDHHDGYGPGLMVSHHALVTELTTQQKTKSELFNVAEQTDVAGVKADTSHQLDQTTLGTDSEWFSHAHLQKTTSQNATDTNCNAKSDVSGIMSAENHAKAVIPSGKVSVVTRPHDIAVGPGYVTKPKVAVSKPKIPMKPVHLKSPVAAGLPEMPFIQEAKSNGSMSEVTTPDKPLLFGKDSTQGGEGNTDKIQGSGDEDMSQRTPETEAKSNKLVPKTTTPEKWVLLPKYCTHGDEDNYKKRKRIIHSGDRNMCQRTSETEAKCNGPVPKIITPDNRLLLAKDHTHVDESDNKSIPKIMRSENQNMCQKTFETKAKNTGLLPKITTPDKGLLHLHKCTHNGNHEKRRQTEYSGNQSKCQRTPETVVRSNDPVSEINTPEKVLLLAKDSTHGSGGNSEKTQRIMLTEDKITFQKPSETGVEIGSRIVSEVGTVKCDSDVSSEDSLKIMTVAGQPLASTPIPPPRRKKLRNRDRLKAGLSREDLDTVSASSSMSSEHSDSRGTSKEATSTTTGQLRSNSVNVASVSPFPPSPIRMPTHTGDQESDCGTFENVPPPPQFDNPDAPLSTMMGNDCLDSLQLQHPQSHGNQENILEDLVAFENRCDLMSDNDVTSTSGCHQQLVSSDTLQDRSSITPHDSDNRFTKENLNKQNQLNILVEEDYLPGHVPVAPELLPPQPVQPWEVSMAMSAHLMDLACRPWDDTVVPPVDKTSGCARPTVVDYVWQMKSVELWDTSDVCDWCKTALDFDALADAFEECAVSGVQLLQLTGPDLSDLGITDALDRNTLLDEIARLQRKQRDSAPFWNLKQISIRRKSLELSNDILKRRLSRLQELNDKQDVQISEYLTELQDEQRRTHQLINAVRSRPQSPQVTSSPTPLSSTARRHRSGHNEMPLMTWTNRDVLRWLCHVGLGKFIGTFAEHKIMGTDLAGISMHLLDKMDIMTTDDRELILAELYKLQHPVGPSLEQVIQEQRSWSSEYSDHSSSTPREDLSEPVGSHVGRREPLSGDVEPVDRMLEMGVASESCVQYRPRNENKTLSVDPLLGHLRTRRGSIGQSVVSPLCGPPHPDSFNSGRSNSDQSHTGNSGDNLELLQELALLRESLRERDDVICQLRTDHTRRDTDYTDQENPPLSEVLSGRGPQCVECHTTQATPSGDFGFMIGQDLDGQVIVKHVADGQPLCQGDRLLEVNGRNVYWLQEREVIHLLQKVKDTLVVVVLRNMDSQPIREDVTIAEELESMRDSLSLAMLEVEATQQENKDLNEEMEQLKQSRADLMADNEALSNKTADLETRLAESETSRRGMYTILERIGNSASTTVPQHGTPDGAIPLMNGQTKQVQFSKTRMPNGHLADDRHSDTSNSLASEDGEADLGNVLSYDLFDEKLPLWESLRTAPKTHILQALKDHILETAQQKEYLDQLLAMVITTAPHLLDSVDTKVGLCQCGTFTCKIMSEEFC